MARVKRGNVARKRRKKVLKLAKGFRGSHSKLFRTANQQVMKALRNAYRDQPPQEARLPSFVDCQNQRRCSLERHNLQPLDG